VSLVFLREQSSEETVVNFEEEKKESCFLTVTCLEASAVAAAEMARMSRPASLLRLIFRHHN
jgi:hypothetical protein